jgi:hypothetical protein
MGEVLAVLFFAGMFIIPGVLLVISGFAKRPPLEPPKEPVPTAQVVQGGHSRIREPRVKGRKRRALGRAARFVFGGALISVGSLIAWIIHDIATNGFLGEGMTKGRLLRLRGKAVLPPVARGDGWHDGAVPRTEHLAAAERRMLAEAWHTAARMEHASVPAFSQLALHLAALGAPAELIERSHRAALDEIKHARRCFAIARAYGGEPWTAGAIPGLGRGDDRAVDLVRLAVGSLVDGCVNEGIAADVAGNGARGAEDPVIRESLAMIADDEERHAELAWSVLAWCLDTGGEPVRAAVAARAARLDAELAPRAPDFTGVAPERLAAHGLFDQDTIGALAARRVVAVRERALAMTAIALAA